MASGHSASIFLTGGAHLTVMKKLEEDTQVTPTGITTQQRQTPRPPFSFLFCTLAYILCILCTTVPLYNMMGGLQTHLWISRFIAKFDTRVHFPANLGLATNGYISQQETRYLEFLLLMLLVFTIYGCAYLLARRSTEAHYRLLLGLISLTTIVSGAIYLFAPTSLSDDVYSYASYGRLLSVHHANPYFVPPSAYPQDSTYALVHWKETVSIYGPVWMIVSAVVGLVSGPDRFGYLFAFRLCAFAAHLLNILLVTATLRTLGRSQQTIVAGALFYAWNPLVVLESSLGGHNDVFMLTFLLLGLWLSARMERDSARHFLKLVPPLIAFTLAALVKLSALPAIALFIGTIIFKALQSSQAPAPWRLALLQGLFSCGVCAIIACAGYAPFWFGHSINEIAYSFSSQPTARYAFNSVLAVIGLWKQAHGIPAYLALLNNRGVWDAITLIIIILTLAPGLIWLQHIPTTRTVALTTLAVLGASLLVTPWFLSWYVTWVVGLAAVSLPVLYNRPGRALFAFTLAFSASALLTYYYISIDQVPLIQHLDNLNWFTVACLATFGIPLLAFFLAFIFPRYTSDDGHSGGVVRATMCYTTCDR